MIQKDLNLFSALKTQNAKSASSAAGIVVASSIFLAAVLAAYGGVTFRKMRVESEARALKAQMASEKVQSERQAFALINEENNKLLLYRDGLTRAGEQFDRIPIPTNALFARIERALPPSVRVHRYAVTDLRVELGCFSREETAAADLLSSLRATGLFDELSYLSVKPRSGEYGFEITGTLNPAAVRDLG